MSLSNPNKFVTEERLAEFYTQILPYLGGMPEAVCNKFDKANLYSTDEKIVGCWIDGRPLYKKTIQCTMPQATTDGTEVLGNTATGVSINECVKYDTYLKASNFRDGNYVFGDSATKRLRTEIKINNGAWYIEIRNAYVSANAWVPYVTIYYTKTTDAANSFKWGDENDYSTDEKIVGTWIDGSYVYQKTFNIGALPNGGTKHVAHNISNFGTLIKIFGAMKGSNQASLPFVMGGSASAITLNDLNYQVMVAVDTTNIDIAVNQNLSSFNGYITLQYTKTT